MRANMGHRIRLPHIPNPSIKGQILMCWCHKGVVINLFRVLAKATRRLHGHKNIAIHSARHEDIAVILHNFARCLAPILNQLLLHLLLHPLIKGRIFLALQLIRSLHLLFSKQAAVIGSVSSQLLDKLLCILRNCVQLIATLLH